MLVDITAQRQAQMLAEKVRDEALEASRLKSEFLASVSHEIRTPMNGVIGVAELLAGTALDDEQREYLKAIQDSAQALLVVINDILDFARIEAGRIATVSEPFDILALVDGVIDILAPRARQKGLDLLVFVDPQLPRTVVGDGGRVRQVLLNLVGNAVKFAERGHVAIDVTPAATAEAAIKREPKRDAQGRSYATGRRKDAVARVWIKPGKGQITINDNPAAKYFARPVLRMLITQPFLVADRYQQFDVICSVVGGGLSGQAGAVRHGISRALCNYEPDLRSILKKAGFLTRDPRVVERKKYGRPKARRSFQFSKR